MAEAFVGVIQVTFEVTRPFSTNASNPLSCPRLFAMWACKSAPAPLAALPRYIAGYRRPVPLQEITGVAFPLPLQVKVLLVSVGSFAPVKSTAREPALKKLLLSSVTDGAVATKLPWMASFPIDPAAHGCSGTQVVSPNGTELPKTTFFTSSDRSGSCCG